MHLRAQGHQGAYGPLRPPNKAKVPLWMAFNLKLKKKCHIVAPDWLNVGALEVLMRLSSASLYSCPASQNIFRGN